MGRTQAATKAALRKYLGIKERGSAADSAANTSMVLETKEEAALVIEVPAAPGDQGARRSRRRAEVEGGQDAEAGGREERSKRRRKSSAVTGLQV